MKFSIITCTYNSGKYLQKNIDSVKNQSFKDYEHIFIDGFSTDKTVEIIKKYQQEFPDKVKLFQFEPQGIADAMNKGIDKSGGEFIIHLHSDDSLFSNDVLENVDSYTKKNGNIEWFYGKSKCISTSLGIMRIIPHRKIYQKIRYWLLLMTDYIPHQSVFIKKDIFKKFGRFDDQYKNAMDYEFWIRLAKNNVSSKFMDAIICNFSVRPDSQSTIGKNHKEHEMIYRKHVKNRLIVAFLLFVDSFNRKRNFF